MGLYDDGCLLGERLHLYYAFCPEYILKYASRYVTRSTQHISPLISLTSPVTPKVTLRAVTTNTRYKFCSGKSVLFCAGGGGG
jgi:hypothetical protein